MGAVDIIRKALSVALPNLAVSNGSIEQKIVDVVGTFADSEAIERQNTLNTINSALASQKVTTVEYYRRKAVEFQEGDELVYDSVNQGGYYETINEDKRIIKQAYFAGAYPYFTLFVNKVGDDGRLTTLTETQLNGFKTYFEAFRPLGLSVTIESKRVAEITDPAITIYVQAGADSAKIASEINENMRAYEQTLRRNNLVSLTEISDIIQKSPEVLAVGFGSPTATEYMSGGATTINPTQGVFRLTTGVFTFATEITTNMIKVLQ